MPKGNPIKNIVGKKFGRLTVIKIHGRKDKRLLWSCMCDCGEVCIVKGINLSTGKTRSCGCLNTERITKHSNCYSRIYRCWICMKGRCLNPNNTAYKNYGGRGIKICKRWLLFDNFYIDMFPTYAEGLSLERKRVNGNYSKSNCCWANAKQQARNRRNNVFIEIDGVRRTSGEWAELTNQKICTINTRRHRGWSNKESVYGKI